MCAWPQVTLLAALLTNHLAPLVVRPYVVGDALLPHIVDTLKRAKGTDSPVVRALALALRVRSDATAVMSLPPYSSYFAFGTSRPGFSMVAGVAFRSCKFCRPCTRVSSVQN